MQACDMVVMHLNGNKPLELVNCAHAVSQAFVCSLLFTRPSKLKDLLQDNNMPGCFVGC